LRLLFLGTGTSTGVPMIGCDCPVCRSEDTRDQRTRPSIMLSWGGLNVVVDTSVEFRGQMLRHQVRRLDAVLYTHSHADHIHGIDDIRGFNLLMGRPVPAYASPDTCRFFREGFRYIFQADPSTPNIPRLDLHAADGPFPLLGKTITPVPIRHGDETILGYRVDHTAYLTDCSGVPDASWPLLRDLDVLVVGALRPKPHPKHFSVGQALDFIERVQPRRAFLTHISHRLCHRDAAAGLPPGVELAYDGLSVEV